MHSTVTKGLHARRLLNARPAVVWEGIGGEEGHPRAWQRQVRQYSLLTSKAAWFGPGGPVNEVCGTDLGRASWKSIPVSPDSKNANNSLPPQARWQPEYGNPISYRNPSIFVPNLCPRPLTHSSGLTDPIFFPTAHCHFTLSQESTPSTNILRVTAPASTQQLMLQRRSILSCWPLVFPFLFQVPLLKSQ